MKANKSIKLIAHLFVLLFITVSMVLFNMISPYALWDITVKQVDEDALLVLRLFWGIVLAVDFVLAFFTYSYKKVLFAIYSVLALLSVLKFLSLLLV